MKKNLFVIALFALLFGFQTTQAQIHKFLTTGFSVMEKDAKGNWGKWSDFEKASIVVTLDTDKNRIVVYSQEVQWYSITEYLPTEENENDLVYPFLCLNEDGEPFTISIITRKNQGNRKQMYLNHRDVILVYNIINFPEGARSK